MSQQARSLPEIKVTSCDEFSHFVGSIRPTQRNPTKGIHDLLPCRISADIFSFGNFIDHARCGVCLCVTGSNGIYSDTLTGNFLRESLAVVC